MSASLRSILLGVLQRGWPRKKKIDWRRRECPSRRSRAAARPTADRRAFELSSFQKRLSRSSRLPRSRRRRTKTRPCGARSRRSGGRMSEFVRGLASMRPRVGVALLPSSRSMCAAGFSTLRCAATASVVLLDAVDGVRAACAARDVGPVAGDSRHLKSPATGSIWRFCKSGWLRLRRRARCLPVWR